MNTRIPRVLSLLLAALCLEPDCIHTQVQWFKYLGNPVVRYSANSLLFDGHYALAPAVIHDDSSYRMWYVGFCAATQKYTIGFALSGDGINWQKHGDQPVLKDDPLSSFESGGVWVSSVMPTESGYRMYYSGMNGARLQLAIAFSRDGIVWERSGENPLLPPAPPASWEGVSTYAASVLQISPGDYRMWYTGQNSAAVSEIGYATSGDGVHWTRYAGNPIVMRGSPGSWKEKGVLTPRVYADGTFHMFYLGQDRNDRGRIGYAFSADGISWKEYSMNPVLYADAGTYDGVHIIDHSVLYENGVYRMWYSLFTNNRWQIGYAVSESRPVDVENALRGSVSRHRLFDAYPNPFNSSAILRYDLPKACQVSLKIFDNLGREVAVLVNERKDAGVHDVQFDATGLSTGVYFYRLKAAEFVETKRLMLLR
jgi:predicted GH43/DUF377 family glycosyl hydrolase